MVGRDGPTGIGDVTGAAQAHEGARDPDGTIVGAASIVHEVTDRPRAPESGGSILLVEDSEILAKAMSRSLSSDGHAVVVAHTLAAARARLADDLAIAFVIADLSLPDGSGADLVDWIAGARPALAAHLIVLTGAAVSDPVAARLIDAGVRVLTKPVPSRTLLALLTGSSAP
jgi:CheY-like chemotaxis protein